MSGWGHKQNKEKARSTAACEQGSSSAFCVVAPGPAPRLGPLGRSQLRRWAQGEQHWLPRHQIAVSVTQLCVAGVLGKRYDMPVKRMSRLAIRFVRALPSVRSKSQRKTIPV